MPAGRPVTTVSSESSGHRPWDRRTVGRLRKFLLVLCTLFLLNVVTTELILRRGGIERNPLLTGITSNPYLHLLIKAAIILLVYPVSVIAERRVNGSGTLLYYLLCGLYFFIVVHNISIIRTLGAG